MNSFIIKIDLVNYHLFFLKNKMVSCQCLDYLKLFECDVRRNALITNLQPCPKLFVAFLLNFQDPLSGPKPIFFFGGEVCVCGEENLKHPRLQLDKQFV